MAGGINYTPGTYATNHVITAAEFATETTTAFTNLQGAYTTYVPALTSSGTTPTLGTGSSATGRWYRQGKDIRGHADIVFGSSGVVAGTGVYEISLPVAGLAGDVTTAIVIGSGIFVDASGPLISAGSIRLQSTTTVRLLYHGATTGLSATAPVVPAASDRIHVEFSYEAA